MEQITENSYSKFRADILKIASPRHTKPTSTLTSKMIIRSIRKTYSESRIVSEDTYSKIIRRINELLIEELFKGQIITLPYNMGNIILTSKMSKIFMSNGKLVRTAPINWSETLKLWYNNSKAYNNKTKVRDLPTTIYRFRYTKSKIGFRNQQYYKFIPCRTLKLKLKELLNNNIGVPAYEYGIHFN